MQPKLHIILKLKIDISSNFSLSTAILMVKITRIQWSYIHLIACTVPNNPEY